jgi:hypothetical protein
MLDGIEVFHADARQPHGHVLFIHGVAGDGWQWRENILPWFAAHGLAAPPCHCAVTAAAQRGKTRHCAVTRKMFNRYWPPCPASPVLSSATPWAAF